MPRVTLVQSYAARKRIVHELCLAPKSSAPVPLVRSELSEAGLAQAASALMGTIADGKAQAIAAGAGHDQDPNFAVTLAVAGAQASESGSLASVSFPVSSRATLVVSVEIAVASSDLQLPLLLQLPLFRPGAESHPQGKVAVAAEMPSWE